MFIVLAEFRLGGVREVERGVKGYSEAWEIAKNFMFKNGTKLVRVWVENEANYDKKKAVETNGKD